MPNRREQGRKNDDGGGRVGNPPDGGISPLVEGQKVRHADSGVDGGRDERSVQRHCSTCLVGAGRRSRDGLDTAGQNR